MKTQATVSSPRGEIFISDQAIAAVVRGALNEVSGIHGLAPVQQDSGVLGVFSKASREHSDINITSNEDGSLHITLNLVINYGTKLDEVAREAMNTVRDRVRTLAGVEVANIDVEIKGLHYDKKPHLTS
jgi:uncharacterized alkaline shock family protein YloU